MFKIIAGHGIRPKLFSCSHVHLGKEKAQRRSAVTRNMPNGGADFYIQQPNTCFAFVGDAMLLPAVH